MSQKDNYETGRGCLGVVALLMAVLLIGGFALNTAIVHATTKIDTSGETHEKLWKWPNRQLHNHRQPATEMALPIH